MTPFVCDNPTRARRSRQVEMRQPLCFRYDKGLRIMDSEKEASYYYWQHENLFIDLLVQTYASQDKIVGIQSNRLKVRLASTPVAGKANDHLLKLMAEYYGVPLHRVHLTKGHQSKMKQICIANPQNNLPPE